MEIGAIRDGNGYQITEKENGAMHHIPSINKANGRKGSDDKESSSRSGFEWRECWRFTGPGFLMSIAYIDPGNFESDLAGGARFGYKLLWVLLWATVIGFLFQVLSIRMGIVSSTHLSRACRDEYPQKFKIFLWLAAELAIIASDIPEVIGTAFAIKILFGIPTWIGIILTGLSTLVFLTLQMFGMRKLEACIGAMVGAISLCFVAEMFLAHESFQEILYGMAVPRIGGSEELYVAISLLGAVVMPHNLYLHSALVLSREIGIKDFHLTEALKYNYIESGAALCVSLFINCAVMAVAAATIVSLHQRDPLIDELTERPLQGAPVMLKRVLGSSASTLFGIALLASGQSSTITGTYAGQFVMEGFVDIKISPATRSFLTRLVAILPSLSCALIAGDSGSESLIILSSVLLAFQLPFALVPLLKFTSSPLFMGERFASTSLMRAVGYTLTIVIVVCNLVLAYMQLVEFLDVTNFLVGSVLALIFGLAYVVAIGYMIRKPLSLTTVPIEHGASRRTLKSVNEGGEDAAQLLPQTEEQYNVPTASYSNSTGYFSTMMARFDHPFLHGTLWRSKDGLNVAPDQDKL